MKTKYKRPFGSSRAFRKHNTTTYYLFDILNDPLEEHNLADKHPDVVDHLAFELDNMKKNHVPPLNPPDLKPSPKSDPKYWGDTWSPGWC
jgi:hypothetical protein